jgi:hypothetical protein
VAHGFCFGGKPHASSADKHQLSENERDPLLHCAHKPLTKNASSSQWLPVSSCVDGMMCLMDATTLMRVIEMGAMHSDCGPVSVFVAVDVDADNTSYLARHAFRIHVCTSATLDSTTMMRFTSLLAHLAVASTAMAFTSTAMRGTTTLLASEDDFDAPFPITTLL